MDHPSRAMAALLITLVSLVPPANLASQPSSGSPQQLRISGLDGHRLRDGIWAYDIIVRLDGEERLMGTRVLMIEPTVHRGQEGWLLVEMSRSGETKLTDSLVLDRSTLTPRHRSLHVGPTALAANFEGDSVRGIIRSARGELPFSALVPADAIISAGMLEVVVRLHDLEPGWARRADLLVLGASGQSHSVPTDLRITGAEQVTVPAGAFASWTASSTAHGEEQQLWLSRDAHVLLRSSSESPLLPGARFVLVLRREELAP